MDNMIYSLFLCVTVPLILSLFVLEKRSRLTMGFILIGMLVCVIVSELNGVILRLCGNDLLYVTTTFTPITEEVIKALPLLYYAAVFSKDRVKLLNISFATGIGFAVMENIIVSTYVSTDVTLMWSLIRGFGSGLMHGVCTVMVGLGIASIWRIKRVFSCGLFALLTFAIIYHATYNCLVQSKYPLLGFLLPTVTYIPLLIGLARMKKNEQKEKEENAEAQE